MPILTSPRIAPLLAVGAWLSLAPGMLRAQDTVRPAEDAAARVDHSPSTSITGFRGIEFGASAEDIQAVFGDPIEDRQLDNGLRMLAYRGELAGEPSLILFGVLGDRGFVKAQEVIDLAGGSDCIAEIRQIQHEINLTYPLIMPAEQARNNTPDTICEAAPKGGAFWHRQWRDESTGAVITVSVPSRSDEVDVIYESRAFRDWVGPDSNAGTDVIEDEGAPTEVLQKR